MIAPNTINVNGFGISCGFWMLWMLSMKMIVAETTKKPTTAKVINGSAFPCPYGWFSSAGLAAYFKPKRTNKEEKISVVDSIASAIKAYEFPTIPAIPFVIARKVFPAILK